MRSLLFSLGLLAAITGCRSSPATIENADAVDRVLALEVKVVGVFHDYIAQYLSSRRAAVEKAIADTRAAAGNDPVRLQQYLADLPDAEKELAGIDADALLFRELSGISGELARSGSESLETIRELAKTGWGPNERQQLYEALRGVAMKEIERRLQKAVAKEK